jgi:hypothetical protein
MPATSSNFARLNPLPIVARVMSRVFRKAKPVFQVLLNNKLFRPVSHKTHNNFSNKL